MLGLLSPLAQAKSTGGGGGLTSLLFLGLMGVFFYVLLIRPQRRRQQQQRQLLDSLDVGDEVMTVAGIYGTIRRMDEDRVTVEVAPGVDLQMSKSAIARKLVLDEGPDEDEYEEEEEPEGEEEERGAGTEP